MGEAQAINAGDFLITRAFEALLAAPAPAGRPLAALRVLNKGMARMIAGQWADVSFESRDDVSTGEYIEMVRGKTGALLGAPLEIGALLAGASEAQAQALGVWGEIVGLAFQVRDDELGIWGNPNLTGKSTSSDIARRKKTLPIVHGLASPSAAPDIRAVYEEPDVDTEGVARVVAALDRVRAQAVCQETAEALTEEADAILDSFEIPEDDRAELRAVGQYLINRDR
jgi:geranylgeranyl diphosphate synthase type I